MPRLLLLRHAKSSKDISNIMDFNRPLTKRGLKDAGNIGKYIAQKGLYPQRILCSSAQRTRETYAAILPFLPENHDVRFTKSLFEADSREVVSAIHQFGEMAETLLIIGHNPTIEMLAKILAPRGHPTALNEMKQKFPSGALAIIDFNDAHWKSIIPGMGWLAGFTPPRELG